MPLSVLFVGDSREDAALLRDALASEPRIRIEAVSSRAEAVRALHDRPFDVVLLDLDLPDSRGLHTLAGLVSAHPELPVVVLTGFGGGDPDLALEALRLGAQDFVARSEIARTDWRRVLMFARERKRHERRAAQYAHVDALTGLPLPHILRQHFERATARASRSGRCVALLALALGGHARLREEAGAAVADRAVAALAMRLRRNIRRADTLAAAPPAGFRLLLENVREAADVERALARLRRVCGDVTVVGEGERALRLLEGWALWDPARPVPFAALECAAERALHGGASMPHGRTSDAAVPETGARPRRRAPGRGRRHGDRTPAVAGEV